MPFGHARVRVSLNGVTVHMVQAVKTLNDSKDFNRATYGNHGPVSSARSITAKRPKERVEKADSEIGHRPGHWSETERNSAQWLI